MPNSTKRLAHELIIVAALMLGSCARYPEPMTNQQKVEAAYEAAFAAIRQGKQLEMRVARLEQRLAARQ